MAKAASIAMIETTGIKSDESTVGHANLAAVSKRMEIKTLIRINSMKRFNLGTSETCKEPGARDKNTPIMPKYRTNI
jgi:hypothetical protein